MLCFLLCIKRLGAATCSGARNLLLFTACPLPVLESSVCTTQTDGDDRFFQSYDPFCLTAYYLIRLSHPSHGNVIVKVRHVCLQAFQTVLSYVVMSVEYV